MEIVKNTRVDSILTLFQSNANHFIFQDAIKIVITFLATKHVQQCVLVVLFHLKIIFLNRLIFLIFQFNKDNKKYPQKYSKNSTYLTKSTSTVKILTTISKKNDELKTIFIPDITIKPFDQNIKSECKQFNLYSNGSKKILVIMFFILYVS